MNLLKEKIIKHAKDDLIVHTVIVFIAGILVGGVNLLYHIMCVRLLSIENYGTFNAIVSFIMFTSMTFSPLGATLTRFFTEHITRKDFSVLALIFETVIKRLIILGIVIFGIVFLLSGQIAQFLKTERIYILFAGATIALSIFSIPLPSLLQSFQKFKSYSSISIAAALGKLGFGYLFIMLGWGILGGMGGFFVSFVITILIALCFLSGIYRDQIGKVNRNIDFRGKLIPVYKYFVPVSITLFSFTLMTNIDVVLVKHLFSSLDAGYYSVAQMVGKVALFLPSALAVVLLPKSTAENTKKGQPLKLLRKSLALAALFCSTFIVFVFLYPDFILKVLIGKTNPISLSLIGYFAITMSFYALAWIIINFLLGMHNTKCVVPLAILPIAQGATIYYYHPDLQSVLFIMLAYGAILFLSLFFIAAFAKKHETSLT